MPFSHTCGVATLSVAGLCAMVRSLSPAVLAAAVIEEHAQLARTRVEAPPARCAPPAPVPGPPPRARWSREEEADREYTAAQDAYVHGHYRQALARAKKLARWQPTKALSLMAASSCFLKDVRGVAKTYRLLDPMHRQIIRYVCQRNGIELSESGAPHGDGADEDE